LKKSEVRLFYKAIELDPDFASAYGMAAWCYAWRKWNGWMADPMQEITETERLARRAGELGQDDAVALCRGGFSLGHVAGDRQGGAALIDRALVLNPNLATAWLLSGWIRAFLGEPEVAIEHLTRAMRLSPLDPLTFLAQGGIAWAHFFAARYDEASSWAEKALQARPNYVQGMRMAAAGHALAGRLEEARKMMARMRQIDPELRVSNLKNVIGYFGSEDFARYSEGLRKAGLPE
jgi:tetratricopeptide (TPR) repeat protein